MATVGVKTYSTPSDLPAVIPVFPLTGALLLPRTQLPLNIFEPRYIAMIDDALAKDRLIGMIQPKNPSYAGTSPELHPIGCAGRLTSFQETSDGRYMITLSGVCRFRILEEISTITPYRQTRVDFAEFADDLELGKHEEAVNRTALIDALKKFLHANNMETDWEGIHNASCELLVNALSAMSPFGPAEKQALLEAKSLKLRADTLIALTEFSLAGEDSSSHIQ